MSDPLTALTATVLSAMLAWVPLDQQAANGESETDAQARYASIAHDISSAVLSEDPLFGSHLKTALELASIASFESGFQRVVDNGTCNLPSHKADARGSCDSKQAFTLWQIHANTGGGLMLLNSGVTSKQYDRERAAQHPEEVWTGDRLVHDRRAAAILALHLVRASYSSAHSLCHFSGESCASGAHPKADARHARAVEYLRTHTPE